MSSGPAAEKQFKDIVLIIVILLCITLIAFFLLAIKILLIFYPEIHLMGLTFSKTF